MSGFLFEPIFYIKNYSVDKKLNNNNFQINNKNLSLYI